MDKSDLIDRESEREEERGEGKETERLKEWTQKVKIKL